MHVCVCVFLCVYSSLVACLQTTISLAAVEWATKSKPFCAAVCYAAIPLKTWAGTHSTTATHTRWETRLFHWPQQTPSATLPTRHTEFYQVLAFPIRAAFMTLHLYCLSLASKPVLKCSRAINKASWIHCEMSQNWTRAPEVESSGWYRAVTGHPGVSAHIAVIPCCSTAEITSTFSDYGKERPMTRLSSSPFVISTDVQEVAGGEKHLLG